MTLRGLLNIIIIILFYIQCTGQEPNNATTTKVIINKNEIQQPKIEVAAAQIAKYLPLLKDRKVGIVANHTSMINNTHLVDSLVALKVNVVKVFSPEHGFRGKADAGEKVNSDFDATTGLPIISLYGKNKKPTPKQIADLDVLIFDIQDVGARFYTYISTMHYIMEAAAENNKKVIILDRPNPNGHYVDGPILEKEFSSFIGMHQVPIVHGMTVGEYAQMINGEGWLANGKKCDLTVIKTVNYTHKSLYQLPIKPSPNLPNMASVYLYPSLCLFEGTTISVGRGTDKPFQILGHPLIKSEKYSFTPKPSEGAKNPKLNGEKCFGHDLSSFGEEYMKNKPYLNLFWIIDIYNNYPKKDEFFIKSFNLLAGTDKLKQQLKAGISEQDIYKSWQPGLKQFKQTRKKYLLYPDFE